MKRVRFALAVASALMVTTWVWAKGRSPEDEGFPPETATVSDKEPSPEVKAPEPPVADAAASSVEVSTPTENPPTPEASAPGDAPAVSESPAPVLTEAPPQPTVNATSPSEVRTESSFSEPPASVQPNYAVKKGDTLWDISGSKYADPFKWPNIYEANKTIINDPHWIFPNQMFVIPGLSQAADSTVAPTENMPETPVATETTSAEPSATTPTEAAVPAPKVEEMPKPEPPVLEATPVAAVETPSPAATEAELGQAPPSSTADESATPPQSTPFVQRRGLAAGLGQSTFISEEDWDGDGVVLRDRDSKIMISQDDVIYISLETEQEVKPRSYGSLYRKEKVVRHPKTREAMGVVVKKIGTFQITQHVGAGSATAVVLSSLEPIEVGDLVEIESR